ncbi:hypothetical protein SAMD00079811_53020 [Scytonema sp. HK-05]|nr:hypothetical protein SAMD00079811_53020 [Scytonema sp. HK-05]
MQRSALAYPKGALCAQPVRRAYSGSRLDVVRVVHPTPLLACAKVPLPACGEGLGAGF